MFGDPLFSPKPGSSSTSGAQPVVSIARFAEEDTGSYGRPFNSETDAGHALNRSTSNSAPAIPHERSFPDTGLSPFFLESGSIPDPSLSVGSYPLSSPASLIQASYPHNPANPFDAILPRGLLYLFIDLFFDYIYALIPCVHRPSFMADLHAGREERPGEEEWTALVLTIVASTLVQTPRAIVPLARNEVRQIVEKCAAVTRQYLGQDYREPTTSRCEVYHEDID